MALTRLDMRRGNPRRGQKANAITAWLQIKRESTALDDSAGSRNHIEAVKGVAAQKAKQEVKQRDEEGVDF